MFKNLTVDMWIAKDTYQFRQVELNATIVPPRRPRTRRAINGITLKATISMAPATAPLTVTPPADVKPFSELREGPRQPAGPLLRSPGRRDAVSTSQ